jgi:hypothetical protein
MSENSTTIEHQENNNSTQSTLELKQKWLILLQKLIPIANSLSIKLITCAIFGMLISIWLALFCYQLNGFSLIYTSIISAISFIPTLILYIYYIKLQEITEPSQQLHHFSNNTELASQKFLDEIKKIKEIKSEQINTFNLIKQGKRIYELIDLIISAKDMLSQYISVGFLISPLTLLLLTGAFLGLGLLTVVFVITLIMAIF